MPDHPPLISVILPVYNVAPYLAKCLESICTQSYPHLEIICIDDASTDGSAHILQTFAQKDPRIQIHTHQQNQSCGTTRNSGIQKATGIYTTFVDPDDYITPQTYEILVAIAETYHTDIVAYPIQCYNEVTKKLDPELDPFYHPTKEGFYLIKDLSQALRDKPFETFFAITKEGASCCNKLYRSEFIRPFRFIEKHIFEDMPFHFRTLLSCKTRVSVLDERVRYYYRIKRPDSTMTSTAKHFKSPQIAQNILDYFLKEIQETQPQLFPYAVVYKIFHYHYILQIVGYKKTFIRHLVRDSFQTLLRLSIRQYIPFFRMLFYNFIYKRRIRYKKRLKQRRCPDNRAITHPPPPQ